MSVDVLSSKNETFPRYALDYQNIQVLSHPVENQEAIDHFNYLTDQGAQYHYDHTYQNVNSNLNRRQQLKDKTYKHGDFVFSASYREPNAAKSKKTKNDSIRNGNEDDGLYEVCCLHNSNEMEHNINQNIDDSQDLKIVQNNSLGLSGIESQQNSKFSWYSDKYGVPSDKAIYFGPAAV